jgi:hypothetical protein
MPVDLDVELELLLILNYKLCTRCSGMNRLNDCVGFLLSGSNRTAYRYRFRYRYLDTAATVAIIIVGHRHRQVRRVLSRARVTSYDRL